MTFEEKKKIADNYLNKVAGIDWDTLSDTNSLHDYETEEEIIEACKERLETDGYPMDLIE